MPEPLGEAEHILDKREEWKKKKIKLNIREREKEREREKWKCAPTGVHSWVNKSTKYLLAGVGKESPNDVNEPTHPEASAPPKV